MTTLLYSFVFIYRKCDELYYLPAFMCPPGLASSLHLKVIIFCFVFSLFISLMFSFQCYSNSRLMDVSIISNPLKLNSPSFWFLLFQGKAVFIISAGLKAVETENNICLLRDNRVTNFSVMQCAQSFCIFICG